MYTYPGITVNKGCTQGDYSKVCNNVHNMYTELPGVCITILGRQPRATAPVLAAGTWYEDIVTVQYNNIKCTIVEITVHI